MYSSVKSIQQKKSTYTHPNTMIRSAYYQLPNAFSNILSKKATQFDLNLKLNFENGKVVQTLPTHKIEQQLNSNQICIQNQYMYQSNYLQNIENNEPYYNVNTNNLYQNTLSVQQSLNYSQDTINSSKRAEDLLKGTLNLEIYCVVCKKSFKQNQYGYHLQLHRKSDNKAQDRRKQNEETIKYPNQSNKSQKSDSSSLRLRPTPKPFQSIKSINFNLKQSSLEESKKTHKMHINLEIKSSDKSHSTVKKDFFNNLMQQQSKYIQDNQKSKKSNYTKINHLKILNEYGMVRTLPNPIINSKLSKQSTQNNNRNVQRSKSTQSLYFQNNHHSEKCLNIQISKSNKSITENSLCSYYKKLDNIQSTSQIQSIKNTAKPFIQNKLQILMAKQQKQITNPLQILQIQKDLQKQKESKPIQPKYKIGLIKSMNNLNISSDTSKSDQFNTVNCFGLQKREYNYQRKKKSYEMTQQVLIPPPPKKIKKKLPKNHLAIQQAVQQRIQQEQQTKKLYYK